MTDPINPAKISDIGTIMAYLSAKRGMQNLSILTISKETSSNKLKSSIIKNAQKEKITLSV